MRGLQAVAALLGIALAAVAGGFTGARLASQATEPAREELVLLMPDLFAGPAPTALRSAGGFTGFGGSPALAGLVIRTGTIELPDDDPDAPPGTAAQAGGSGNFVVRTEQSDAEVRYRDTRRLFRLTPALTPLSVGDTVIARYDGSSLIGLMRITPLLDEGVGAGLTPSQQRDRP